MKILNRLLYFIYVISLTAAIVLFLFAIFAVIYRMVTGSVLMFLNGYRIELLGYAVAGVVLSAFLSNQIDKLIKRKEG